MLSYAEFLNILSMYENSVVVLDDSQKKQLYQFAATLHQWNQVSNFVASKDAKVQLIDHIIDSLSATRVLARLPSQSHVIDCGCGPGLPGVPLAIAMPTLQFTCIDSREKRMAFVRQLCFDLSLTNCHPVCVRLEKYQQKGDMLLGRAVARAGRFVEMTKHMMHARSQVCLFQGKAPDVCPEGFSAERLPVYPGQPNNHKALLLLSRNA